MQAGLYQMSNLTFRHGGKVPKIEKDNLQIFSTLHDYLAIAFLKNTWTKVRETPKTLETILQTAQCFNTERVKA